MYGWVHRHTIVLQLVHELKGDYLTER
jgi:hypothetical protein